MIEAPGALLRFNAITMAFGVRAEAHVDEGICEICGERRRLIEIDLSGGEYGSVGICGRCLRKLAENV